MALFRKKPVVVEATQWFPRKRVRGVSVLAEHDVPGRDGKVAFHMPERAYVNTIHGDRAFLAEGDWVISESDGTHFYPCKPDIFEKTYESADTGPRPEMLPCPQCGELSFPGVPCPRNGPIMGVR